MLEGEGQSTESVIVSKGARILSQQCLRLLPPFQFPLPLPYLPLPLLFLLMALQAFYFLQLLQSLHLLALLLLPPPNSPLSQTEKTPYLLAYSPPHSLIKPPLSPLLPPALFLPPSLSLPNVPSLNRLFFV